MSDPTGGGFGTLVYLLGAFAGIVGIERGIEKRSGAALLCLGGLLVLSGAALWLTPP